MKARKLLLALCAAVGLSAFALDPAVTDIPTLDIALPYGFDEWDINKADYLDCNVRRVEPTTGVDSVYSDAKIKLRGNSTAGLYKRPYKLKFSKKERMMGRDRANAKKWVLLANCTDKSLLRNAVAFRIAELTGMKFVPATEFVDVRISGEYVGSYHLTDQVDVKKKRVHITEQDTIPGTDHDYSGGYLLEFDHIGGSEPNHFYSSKGVCVVVKSPDEDVCDYQHLNYIQNYINNFEKRLFGSDFCDPELGYRAMVDSVSLAGWYITNELSGNPDTFWSNYVYKDKADDTLYFGPVWDFDIAFANCRRKPMLDYQLVIDGGFNPTDGQGRWFQQMWKDPWFQQLICRTWSQLVDSGLEETLLQYVDDCAKILDQSQQKNFEIYWIDDLAYDELQLFDTYEENIDYLKESISRRMNVLTQGFAKRNTGIMPEIPVLPDFCTPSTNGDFYRIYNVLAGMPIGVSGSNVVLCNRSDSDPYQQWYLQQGDGGMNIINRGSGLALADYYYYTNSYEATTDEPDLEDETMLWGLKWYSFDDKTFAIRNIDTYRYLNNRNGKVEAGNQIITWKEEDDSCIFGFELVMEDEPDEPESGQIVHVRPESGHIYNILNSGAAMPLTYHEGNNATYVGLGKLADVATRRFRWLVEAVGEQYMIINQETGLAMTDNSAGVKETDITLAEPNPADLRQLWDFVEVEDAETPTFCIVNADSNLAWNNNGGHSTVGNSLIAWTNDANNFTKPTRQWHFSLSEDADPDIMGIDRISAVDYSVYYSPSLKRVRFLSHDADSLPGIWSLYDVSGRQVAMGAIAPSVSLADVAPGHYILAWQTGGHRRSVKLSIK